jgi:tRNA threonylcarbamoyl adenosine modification protein YeaZ
LDIGTGHAERLMGVIEDSLRISRTGYAALGSIAVATGPGSFTGVRVGVSTARGLALALKIPAIGVTTLEAIANETRSAFPGRTTMVVIDARREECYATVHDELGKTLHAPAVTRLEDAVELARTYDPVLAGSAAALIRAAAAPREFDVGSLSATADIGVYAELAASRDWNGEKPRPVYLRDPDAKPQASLILPRSAG